MPLHIFLGDEVLLYFIVRIEVVKIQIWFKFKLVCNLQKGLKIYKGFSIFLWRIGPNSRSRPSLPPPTCGPHGPASRRRGPAACWARTRAAEGTRPNNAEFDSIGGYPDPNPLSYPLRRFV
jgi:hypothetical protein